MRRHGTKTASLGALSLVVALSLVGCSGQDEGSADTSSTVGKLDPAATSGPSVKTEVPVPPEKAQEPEGDKAESAQPAKDGLQDAVLARVKGDPSGKCVKVGGSRDVRSGSFVGGPFDTAVSAWKSKQQGTPEGSIRLYWVPLHTEKMPGITVVATHESSGQKVKMTNKTYADAEQWKYYETALELPKPGSWKLQVASGPDKGCFEVVFKD